METTDDVMRDQLSGGHVSKDALSEISEDFFCGLNQEEKECLEYFLQTINTLDGDILKDDDEERHEEVAESLDSEDQAKNTVDSRMQQSTSLEAAPAKHISPHPAASTIKIITSLSEEPGDTTLRSKPSSDCPKGINRHRSADSHPVHLRKFDTIMRSGVNVQELRSRFLLHLDSSATADRETTEDVAGTIKQPGSLPGEQKTTKDGVRQKLELLQRNADVPNIQSPLVSMAAQQTQISLVERLSHEVNESPINTAEEPV